MKLQQLFSDLKYGNQAAAFEAAKALTRIPRISTRQLAQLFQDAVAVHNREAAAYALSLRFSPRNRETVAFLLSIFNQVNENPLVRAQAMEGLGFQAPTRRSGLWPEVEQAVLSGLQDQAVEVRFWACYAAGMLRLKSARPQLEELSRTDFAICPNWWRVSDEAADVIEWIGGRETEGRLPIKDEG